jgi:N-acetylmuramoyl-L-alanine amidase
MFRRVHRTCLPLVFAFACLGGTKVAHPVQSRVEAVRFWSFGDITRIAIQIQGDFRLVTDQVNNPSRVYFDLHGIHPPSAARRGVQTIQVRDRRLRQIRIAEVTPGRTRVVFDLLGPVEVFSSKLVNPNRLIIELRPKATSAPVLSAGRRISPATRAQVPAPRTVPTVDIPPAIPEGPLVAKIPHQSGLLSALPLSTGDSSSSSGKLSAGAHPKTLQTSDGLLVQGTSSPAKPMAGVNPKQVVGVASPATTKGKGDSSLVRVFGLKLGKVVIDAGHGGHDTGTIGPDGLMEKELVIDVALRLGKLITERLGADVVYTRSDDTFIPLEERPKIANHERADLFISVHANSSPEPTATGVETYFFNFNSDKHGLDLATRENATATSSISDLSDLLHKAVLQAKLEESREFAQQIQSALWAGSVKMNGRSRDRGVRQAPFVVLIGATMPSILAEIGFVSNPHDEKLLQRADQRQKIAESLFRGVSQYAKSLSHVQLASAGPE